jgi:methyl-accepting chemotaxis protein
MGFHAILKVKTIIIGGSLLLALAAISGGLATLAGVNTMKERITEIDQRTVTQIALISRAGMDARLSMTKHILTNREANIAAADRALAERITTLDALLADFGKATRDPAQERLLADTIRTWEDWKAQAGEIRRLSAAMDKAGATERLEARLNARGEALQTAIKRMRDSTISEGKTSSQIAAKSADNTQLLALVIVVVAGIAGIAVTALISLRVGRPMAAITRAMNEMARGDLDRSVPIATRPDEIGEIARALEAIKEGIAARTRSEEADRITQQNAALVEESSAAARNLTLAAENLSRLVSQFDHGSKPKHRRTTAPGSRLAA